MPASTEAEISSFYQSIPILTEARSIRVLDVQSAPSANGDGPIQGTLRSVELDKKPNFYALSCVCGTPATGEHLVGCGETLLAVTENCYLALKFLYLKLGRFTIWVDAVCIHQQDGTEKARQIAVMGEVFSNASTVYVWLGLETYRKRIAMRFLSEILLLKFLTVDGTVDGTEFNTPKYWAAFWTFYRSQWLLGWLRCWSRVSKAIPWAALGPSETAQRGEHYTCLPDLLSTAWTERIWTYQEILAARAVVVVCGTIHLDWSHMAFAIVAEDLKGNRLNERLVSWRRLVFTKAHFDAYEDQSKKFFIDRLQRYQALVCRVGTMWGYFTYAVTALAVSVFMGVLVAGTLYAVSSIPFTSILVGLLAGSVAGGGVYVLFNYLPGSGDSRLRHTDSSKDVLLAKASNSEGLIDALSNRKATIDLDMAFGVQYILERLLKRSLPIPDPGATKPAIYQQLTSNVHSATGSLESLPVAAVRHFSDAPSWVVDWTPVQSQPKSWIAQYLGSQTKSATGSSKPIFDLCHSTLTIHGWTLCRVSACASLQATGDEDVPSEEAIHSLNLEKMMDAHKYRMRDWFEFNNLLKGIYFKALTGKTYDKDEDEVLANYLLLLQSFARRRMSGSQLLQYLRNTDPIAWRTKLLYSMWSDQHYHAWPASTRNAILRAHIKICNYMARADQRYVLPSPFNTGVRDKIGRYKVSYVFGIGSGDIKENDLVLLVPGVKIPLIVRENENGSIRLVGTAMLPYVNEGKAWGALSKRLREDLPEFEII